MEFVSGEEEWVFANLDVHGLHVLPDFLEDVFVFLAVKTDFLAVLFLDWLEDLVFLLLSVGGLVLEALAGGGALEHGDGQRNGNLLGGFGVAQVCHLVEGAA